MSSPQRRGDVPRIDGRLDIYDVLELLANEISWRNEVDKRRVAAAIATARENRLFSTEGMMKL